MQQGLQWPHSLESFSIMNDACRIATCTRHPSCLDLSGPQQSVVSIALSTSVMGRKSVAQPKILLVALWQTKPRSAVEFFWCLTP
jgi:hypothetical protein